MGFVWCTTEVHSKTRVSIIAATAAVIAIAAATDLWLDDYQRFARMPWGGGGGVQMRRKVVFQGQTKSFGWGRTSHVQPSAAAAVCVHS